MAIATLPPIEWPTTFNGSAESSASTSAMATAISPYVTDSVQPDRPWLGRSTMITRARSASALATEVQFLPWPNRPCISTTRGPESPISV